MKKNMEKYGIRGRRTLSYNKSVLINAKIIGKTWIYLI